MCLFCSVKCWFVFFNSLFLASGLSLFIIGFSAYTQMGTFAGPGLYKVAVVLIAVGVTIALISLLGLIGAFINNSSMLGCFICLLVVIIILEIVTGAAFYVFRGGASLLQMNSAINTKARGAIYQYNPEGRHAIDRIQEKFSCCGADTYTDWSRSIGWKNHNAVPDSCCTVKRKGCGQDRSHANKEGCIKAIKRFLLKNLVWAGAVCIALGVTEVFAVLLGMCLCWDMKRKNYETLG